MDAKLPFIVFEKQRPGSSLVPSGGTFALSDDPEPKITISLIQHAWWPIR